jgi:hypothetical protein
MVLTNDLCGNVPKKESTSMGGLLKVCHPMQFLLPHLTCFKATAVAVGHMEAHIHLTERLLWTTLTEIIGSFPGMETNHGVMSTQLSNPSTQGTSQPAMGLIQESSLMDASILNTWVSKFIEFHDVSKSMVSFEVKHVPWPHGYNVLYDSNQVHLPPPPSAMVCIELNTFSIRCLASHCPLSFSSAPRC